MSLRADKYIANLGFATRRTAPFLIKKGLFSINGEIIKKADQRIQYGDILHYE